jgi:hypothetical protein
VNATAFVAVGIGAALGAWTRWGLGAALNAIVPNLPLGTLIANLAGGFLIGVAVEFFLSHALIAPLYHHRLSWEPDDIFDLFGRGGGIAADAAIRLGYASDRLPPRRIAADDLAGHDGGSLDCLIGAVYCDLSSRRE